MTAETKAPRAAAPSLAHHTDTMLTEYGFTQERIAALRQVRAI
jgi:crotonobetainyl-CoA:carnitine CoA-transferase CaiB-like acyl-CoA transferase